MSLVSVLFGNGVDMTRKKTWVLVCDASRARILNEEPNGRGYTMVEAFEHAESRAKVRDLVADENGRKPAGPSVGNNGPRNISGRPGAEPDTDPKEVEAQKFARELAAALEKGLNDHAYDTLTIVAPPHFLGLMRGTLNDQVVKRLTLTIDKDFSSLPPRDLEERLRSAKAA